MHSGDKLPLVTEDQSMAKVLISMTSHGFGCAAVIAQDNRLIGVITDGDLRRHMSPDLTSLCARDVMTRSPVTINALSLAAEGLGIMNKRAITSLFVVDHGIVSGIVHIHDCLRAGIK
jgi:arabinose-5-phosphate isomerase